jgi:hypothetical protein
MSCYLLCNLVHDEIDGINSLGMLMTCREFISCWRSNKGVGFFKVETIFLHMFWRVALAERVWVLGRRLQTICVPLQISGA